MFEHSKHSKHTRTQTHLSASQAPCGQNSKQSPVYTHFHNILCILVYSHTHSHTRTHTHTVGVSADQCRCQGVLHGLQGTEHGKIELHRSKTTTICPPNTNLPLSVRVVFVFCDYYLRNYVITSIQGLRANALSRSFSMIFQ